jgi:hypothetical protein
MSNSSGQCIQVAAAVKLLLYVAYPSSPGHPFDPQFETKLKAAADTPAKEKGMRG